MSYYDLWLEGPYQKECAHMEAYEEWFEENWSWLQAEYEEAHGEIVDETGMRFFESWAQDYYEDMVRGRE